jgi:Acyl-CoA dehydrogenase, C-terminal domain
MDTDERALFDQTLRQVTTSATGEALDAALDSLGWDEALASDPAIAVSLLFEHQGAANATSSALDRVLAEALGVAGTPAPAVVLPWLGGQGPPGAVAGEALEIRGLGSSALGRRHAVVVATEDALVTVDPSALTLRPVRGLDPELGLVEVTAHAAPAAGRSALDPDAWAGAVAAGQRALAHELVGASRAMLQLARDHAVDRIQFGCPIASFQAVRHRLAEALVAVEAADAAVGAAWLDGSPLAASLAKAIAGRSGHTVARHAQQVLAGVGFTTEHPLHRYVRRTIVLDRLLGDSRSLTNQLGQQLLDSRRLPPLLPL